MQLVFNFFDSRIIPKIYALFLAKIKHASLNNLLITSLFIVGFRIGSIISENLAKRYNQNYLLTKKTFSKKVLCL